MTDFGNEYTTLYVRAQDEDSEEETATAYVIFDPQPRSRSRVILGVLLGALVLCAVAAVCVPASLHGGDMLRLTRSSHEIHTQVNQRRQLHLFV
jgi:ferric-dicitrate binding protein FerR (iron transport regulator)